MITESQLPITSCGLRLDDEAIRVAVALRLGLDLCVPHVCRCDIIHLSRSACNEGTNGTLPK